MKLKKLSLSLLAAMTLAGCKTKNALTTTAAKAIPSAATTRESTIITLKDSVNRDVTIDTNKVNRVVCIGAGALRLYSYIGDINKVAAVEDIDRGVQGSNPFNGISRPYYDLNKDYFATLPSAGKGGPKNQAAEVETLLATNPDIIISEYNDAKKEDDLQEKLGVPVFTVNYGKKSVFDDTVKTSFTNLGKIFKKEEKASTLIQYIKDAEAELKSKANGVAEADKESLYVGGLGNWGTADIYSTSTSFPLFTVSSIKNAITGVEIAQGNIDHEKLLAANPDKIILDTAGMANMRATYQKDPSAFESLSAFNNNEVYLEMPFNAYYTNLEIALMDAYYIASVAYPTQYQNFDIAAKADEISLAFLGEKSYDLIKGMTKSEGGFRKVENVKEFLSKK
jgi:iron complex transport system substrate-binding protein